jgi:hypothetical protein
MKKKNAPFIEIKPPKNVGNATMATIIQKNAEPGQEALQQTDLSPREKTKIVCTKCI